MRSILLALVLSAGFLPALVASEDGVTLFRESCSGCHTVGGGDSAGPDLLAATQKPRDELAADVVRMEEHVGPLSSEKREALVALLTRPDVKELLVEDAPDPAPLVAPPAGSPDLGRRLFFGEARFANNGSPCFGCHAVHGRGGNLAGDLTRVHDRIGEGGIVTVSERPAFPLMKASYRNHPVQPEEAQHLAAFLRVAAKQPAGAPPGDASTLHGLAAGAAFVVLGSVSLVVRSRRGTVRERLNRRAPGANP
jgi:mono/diheme cytochrome c family protein